MKKRTIVAGAIASLLLSGSMIFFGCTPVGRGIIVGYQYDMAKVEENDYANRKMVEEQCRAYIASYNSNIRGYEQYKESENELERSWAESYRQRANRTAATYNEYITKNSYVFKDHLPDDIPAKLEYV